MGNAKSLIGLVNGGWCSLPFEPFKEGVEAHWLQRETPQMAILRYAPGASVGRHRHEGLETILVLEGTQSDETGTFEAGDFVMNAQGSDHSVWSETGCVVLLQWHKPVTFL